MKKRFVNIGCGKRYHPDWTNIDMISASPHVISLNLLEPWPFDPDSFEFVYHSHVLEHFSRKDGGNFLQNCYRILKPGGIIRVVVPDFEQIARLYLEFLEKSLSGDDQASKCYEWIQLELFDQMVRNHSGGQMIEYIKQNPMPAEEFVLNRCGKEVAEYLPLFRQPDLPEKKKANYPTKKEGSYEIGKFRLAGEVHQWMYDRYSLHQALMKAGFEHIEEYDAHTSQLSQFASYCLDTDPEGEVYHPESLFMEARKPN